MTARGRLIAALSLGFAASLAAESVHAEFKVFACEPDFGLREGLTARWFRGRVGQGADVTSGGPSPLTA